MNIVEKLKALLDERGVLTGEVVSNRSKNYWDPRPLEALAIIRPRSTEELSAVMKVCHQADQTVVTHGGLTGCVNSASTGVKDIVISLERMNQIEEIDAVGRVAVVQAGCTLQTVQEATEEQGLLFPLDLGARGSCTIGGNVATNAGGINVIRYGMTRDLVLGLEAVLADGTVVTSMNQMVKNNTGYDLKQLFIGSEGTLGVVTRVVLKLTERPLSSNSALVACDNFTAVIGLLQEMSSKMGAQLCAFEVMWGGYYRAVTEPGRHIAPIPRDYPYYVLLEVQGSDPHDDSKRFQMVLEETFESELIVDAVLPKSKSESEHLWAIREDFEAILMDKPVFLYDISLPIKAMEAYVDEISQGLSSRWPNCIINVFGHMGDGNLHLIVSPGEDSELLHHQVNEVIYFPLQDFAGSVSAEHGIGMEKKAYLELCRNEQEIALMRLLKQTLDPKGILNPGCVFDL